MSLLLAIHTPYFSTTLYTDATTNAIYLRMALTSKGNENRTPIYIMTANHIDHNETTHHYYFNASFDLVVNNLIKSDFK